MTTIKLKFRPSSINGKKGSLYFQIIHSRKIKNISTPYKIYSFEWDFDKKCIKNPMQAHPNLITGTNETEKNLLSDLEHLRNVISIFEKRGADYTVQDVADFYMNRKTTPKEYSFFNYINYQIGICYQFGKKRRSEIYKQLLNSLKKFMNGKDLLFELIDSRLIQEYEVFLKSANLCRNTTSFYMRTFRSIYNRAVDEDLTEQVNPFKKVYTGVDKTSKRAVSILALKKIKALDLQKMPVTEFARDMFLFSFYTRGMSFIDIACLQKSNVKNGFLTYNRRKTGQQLKIKWEQTMQELVNKYTKAESLYLFPILDNSKKNLRRQYLNKMLLINRHLKKIAVLAEINTQLTMYVARHSWASIAQSKDISLKAISLGLGHDNEETTRIYLSSIQTKIIDEANHKLIKLLA